MSNPDSSGARSAVSVAAMGLWLLAVAGGCGDRAVEQGLESDARGYVCGACTNRFSTAQSVIADICPRCKSNDLSEVLGYVCAKDGRITLGPRSKGGMVCPACGQRTASIKLPSAAELTAWGAVPRTKAEVSPR